MPRIGLGTAEIQNASLLVYEAIKCGYRHIDTAAWYHVEKQIGEAIRRAIDEGIIKREDVFVTSKL